jgi:phosphohistidine phosphatase
MNLYLVRHATAKSEFEDPLRGLSGEGRADIEAVAEIVARSGAAPARILQSGKKRASETAEVLARHIGFDGAVEVVEGLDPMDLTDTWLEHVDASDEDLMLVGHMPYMGKLAAQLTTGNKERDFLEFKTATVLCLKRGGRGAWYIGWMVTPENCSLMPDGA